MERFLFLFEMLGTVAFAASGALLGIHKGMDLFGVCILGLTTACGGGMLRDMMAGDMPYIFVKHVYACASLAGAVLCALLRPAGELPAMLAGAALVFAIRCLSAHYRWNLPRTHD